MNYHECDKDVIRNVKKGVWKTIEYIADRRTKNDMDYYTSQQLDDLKDCAELLACLAALDEHHYTTPNADAQREYHQSPMPTTAPVR